MKNPFNKSVAKEIARGQIAYIFGGILDRNDPDYSISDEIETFEQNFSEDLEEKNIAVTPKRIESINLEFEKIRKSIIKNLEKHI